MNRKQQAIRAEFYRQLLAIKRATYWPDFAPGGECADEDNSPGYLCVTFGANDDLSDWNFQTGDNSYTGGAYGFQHWGAVYMRPRSSCRELAHDALTQILDNIQQSEAING